MNKPYIIDSDHIIAFDVDNTLVMWDNFPHDLSPGKMPFKKNDKIVYLTPHTMHIDCLKSYRDRDFKVIVWSAAGRAWAKEVVSVLKLEQYVDIIMSKLTAHFDDLPQEKILGEHLYFNPTYTDELWKTIEKYPNYQISSYGNVRKINLFGGNAEKKINYNNAGYATVQLSDKSRHVPLSIHRLVAEAFIPNTDNKPVVDHIDGNKFNNSLYNLRWATYSENSRNSKRPVQTKNVSGENNPSVKLTDNQILEIYKRVHSGEKMKDLAKEYGVSSTQISWIRDKKTRKNILRDV